MKLGVIFMGFMVSCALVFGNTRTVTTTTLDNMNWPVITGSLQYEIYNAAVGDTIVFDYSLIGNSPIFNINNAFFNTPLGPLGGFVIDGLKGKPLGADKPKITVTGTPGIGGAFWLDKANTSIIGLEFENVDGNGIFITAANVTIDSCIVHGCTNAGIWIKETASDVTIKNSIIYDNSNKDLTGDNKNENSSIYSYGARTIIDSCYIYGDHANGVLLRENWAGAANNSIIMNSTIGRTPNGTDNGNGWNGVFIWGADNCTTRNNIVLNNGHTPYGDWSRVSGIRYQELDQGLIDDNYIGTDPAKVVAGNDFDGITIHTNVSNLSILNNIICNNGFGSSGAGSGGGIAIRSDDLSGAVSNIQVTDNMIGAHLDSTAAGNGSYGVSLEYANNNNVERNFIGNSVSSSSGIGIWMSFGGCENNSIINNLITENPKAGIEIQGNSTDGYADNNIIGTSGNGNIIANNGIGINVVGGSNNNTLRFNSFLCNSSQGVALTSNGNENYGNGIVGGLPKSVIISENELRPDFISGLAPSASATVDIYLADVCEGDCEDEAYQGAEYITTVNASASAESNGLYFWEYDFVAGGNLVNKNNVVVLVSENGTAGQVNTSEFSVCATLCNTPENTLIDLPDADICKGELASLSVTADGMEATEDYSYTWYRTEVNPDSVVNYMINDNSFDTDLAGNYLVIIASQIDSVACKDTSNTQTISVNELPTVSLPEDDTICFFEEEEFTILATVDTVASGSLSWSTGETDVLSITVTDTINYTATFTDQFGCEGSDNIKLINFCVPPDPEGPNIVNVNNPWRPIGDITPSQFLASELVIFDRWGLKMFSSEKLLPEWRGERENGNSCSPGVYYWIWTYTDNNGDEFKHNGFVQLLNN